MSRRDPDPTLNDTPYQTDSFHQMPYRRLGDSGLQVSSIGVGTWKFGYPETGDGSRSDEATSLAVLDVSYAAGAVFWDTANRYNNGSGNAERIIGTWFENHPERRRDIVLGTKVHGGMDGITPNHSGLSRLQVTEAVKACRQRLGVEWIDLLWFHRFDDQTPVEESLETVADVVQRGWVHYFAVSNVTPGNLSRYLEVSGRVSRRCRPVAVQNRFDPLHGEQHPGVLEICREQGLSYVPYSPLAGGLLSDRYLHADQVKAGDRLRDEGTEVTDADRLALGRLTELSQQWQVPVSQLALAYTLTLPGMGPQIPSSSTPAQAERNAAAGKLQLTAEQVAALAEVFVS
ncbi:MAG: aldo/keto reductase [Actinomycetia bacterium]|nr:aldo/keto reductase [Actinomycetes bacterium]